MKKWLKVSLTMLTGLVLVACGSDDTTDNADNTSDDGGEKNEITFIPKVSGNAFFEAANDGAQEIAQQEGFTVNYDGNPEASVANQVTIINNAIQQGADAIVISSVDATGLDDSLKEAMDAGIPVVTWDSDVSTDARKVMISQGTPDQLGEMLVSMGADSLADRGLDPDSDPIKYVWHYSQATVTDQNSWNVAGEALIAEKYPQWENVAPDNYYSEQDAEKAINIGESILSAYSDIDLIICNDSTALPGQLQAAQNAGLTQDDITITGFAPPSAIRDYASAGVINRWGLWDVNMQGAISVWIADYLANGNDLKIGDKVEVPGVGEVEMLNNSILDENAEDSEDSGIIVLPERQVFTVDNMDDYSF